MFQIIFNLDAQPKNLIDYFLQIHVTEAYCSDPVFQ